MEQQKIVGIEKIGTKLIIDMFYSDNHVEVSLDAFLASEEYAKESIKDVEMVFDQNAAGSTQPRSGKSAPRFYSVIKMRPQGFLMLILASGSALTTSRRLFFSSGQMP